MLNNYHLTWVLDSVMIHPCHIVHPVQHLRGQPGEAPRLPSALYQLAGTKTGHSNLGVPEEMYFSFLFQSFLVKALDYLYLNLKLHRLVFDRVKA